MSCPNCKQLDIARQLITAMEEHERRIEQTLRRLAASAQSFADDGDHVDSVALASSLSSIAGVMSEALGDTRANAPAAAGVN